MKRNYYIIRGAFVAELFSSYQVHIKLNFSAGKKLKTLLDIGNNSCRNIAVLQIILNS